MKSASNVHEAVPLPIATPVIRARQTATAPSVSLRPPLLRARARLLDADAIADALSTVAPTLIEVGMQEMKVAAGNDYLVTRSIKECCALILCTDRHPVTGRYAQRALFHVLGATDFGHKGLAYVDQMIAAARSATRGARFVLCFGSVPVSSFLCSLIINSGYPSTNGEMRYPLRELHAACDDFFIVQADEIQVTPTGMLYTCQGPATRWRPADD